MLDQFWVGVDKLNTWIIPLCHVKAFPFWSKPYQGCERANLKLGISSDKLPLVTVLLITNCRVVASNIARMMQIQT